MQASTHRIHILLIETIRSLSTKVEQILLAKPTLKLFRTVSVSNLKDAYAEIEKENLDLILMETDPQDDPDFSQLIRLHQHGHHIPIVALLAGDHQPAALKVLQAGAQGYLLENQISEDTLPPFLLRTFERAIAQNAIRESEEQFRLMIENASDVILILDKTGQVTFASPSTKRILHIESAEILHKNILDFLHREDRGKFLDHFEQAFQSGELSFVQFRFHSAGENFVHMEGKGRVVLTPAGQRVCILNTHDVSHRVKLEEELKSLALRDELTGLHNRRSFVTTFETQLKIAQRDGKEGFHLLFMDLDGFKWINDNLGHKEGDKALIHAAGLLRNTFRDADVIARLGGDEFVVFLTDGGEAAHVQTLQKRLAQAVDKWNNMEKRPYQLAMSVGALHHNFKTKRTAEDLLREADELMFEQKRGKKRGAKPGTIEFQEEETASAGS